MYGLGVVYHAQRPAWAQWSPGQQIDPYDIPDELIARWTETGPGRPGYSEKAGCYCWGFRPAYVPQTLDGVRWAGVRTPWKICPGACPQPACPTQSCPTCPPQQPCNCPSCPPCETTVVEHAAVRPMRDSTNWLWIAGASFAVFGVYAVRRTLQMKKK